MTSPASAATNARGVAPSHRSARRNGGFTLIEILVVITIIIVLAALLTPSVNKAWKQALRTSIANDLQAIGTALEAYKQDFGDYPRVRTEPSVTVMDATHPNPVTGAQMLCFALMGPAAATDPGGASLAGKRPIEDGADGYGFRARGRSPGADNVLNTPDDVVVGKIYPPYLAPDKFKVGDPSIASGEISNATGRELLFCIVDRWNQPILYFPASPAKPNVTVAATAPNAKPYVDSKLGNAAITSSESSRYDGDDNLIWFTADPRSAAPAGYPEALNKLRFMFGDRHGPFTPPSPPTPGMDGVVQADEQAVDLPFVLWDAGPDEVFAPIGLSTSLTSSGIPDGSDLHLYDTCDDVTNFRN